MWSARRSTSWSGCHGNGKVRKWRFISREWNEPVTMATLIESSHLFCVVSVCEFPSHGYVTIWKGKKKEHPIYL